MPQTKSGSSSAKFSRMLKKNDRKYAFFAL